VGRVTANVIVTSAGTRQTSMDLPDNESQYLLAFEPLTTLPHTPQNPQMVLRRDLNYARKSLVYGVLLLEAPLSYRQSYCFSYASAAELVQWANKEGSVGA
jgi:hypothetical protein